VRRSPRAELGPASRCGSGGPSPRWAPAGTARRIRGSRPRTGVPRPGQSAGPRLSEGIGVDMSRFATAGHLASWAGVCPGNKESAGKRLPGRTRHGDTRLKAALFIASAGAAHSRTTCLGAQFRRLVPHRDAKRAPRRRTLRPRRRLAHPPRPRALPRSGPRSLHQPPRQGTPDPTPDRPTHGPRHGRHHHLTRTDRQLKEVNTNPRRAVHRPGSSPRPDPATSNLTPRDETQGQTLRRIRRLCARNMPPPGIPGTGAWHGRTTPRSEAIDGYRVAVASAVRMASSPTGSPFSFEYGPYGVPHTGVPVACRQLSASVPASTTL